MPGLLDNLRLAARSLDTQSLGLATAGRNVANVGTAGYAREVVVTGGSGPDSVTVRQLRTTLLDQQVVRETSLTASLTALDSANTQAQAALGENIGGGAVTASDSSSTGSGLGNDLAALLNGFQALAATPTELGTRQTLFQTAAALAQRFNSTDTRLAQMQADLGAQATSAATDINQLLTGIADLNTRINVAEFNAPGSAVDLRDQRQAALEQLAGKIGVETAPAAGNPAQIDVFVRDATGAPIDLVSAGSVSNTLAFDGAQFTAGTAATPVALAGGEAQGLLLARDGTVQTLRSQLNTLADQLATSVNAAYNPTGLTGNFFQFTAGHAAATLALDSGLTAAGIKTSDNPATPGDNSLAAAVAALSSRAFSTATGDRIDGTFADCYSGIVVSLGYAVASASSGLEDQVNMQKLVTQQRDSVSGVSLDQEMADLLQYQRAYQASSRVVTLMDGLLDTVINGMGRV